MCWTIQTNQQNAQCAHLTAIHYSSALIIVIEF